MSVVRLPTRPGCLPAFGAPMLIAALVISVVGIRDAWLGHEIWQLALPPAIFFWLAGAWAAFSKHGMEIDVSKGIVRSGTGLFRPWYRNERVLGLPLQLELAPFKLKTKDGIETAHMVMLVGPAGRVKLDDFPDKLSAERRKDELAQLLGLSPPPATN